MNIKYINISEHKYRVEFIPFEECLDFEQESKKFVMLRNFTLLNNIISDDNLYFIEKGIYEEYKLKLKNNEQNDEIVFPSNKNTQYYSTSFDIFNENYLKKDILNDLASYDILEKKKIVDEENSTVKYSFKPKNVKCNLLKIYHPHTKISENLIIHVENVINNIHIHYLCRTYDWFTKNNEFDSKTEYRYENNIYSEYIKCYIPDIRDLFDREIIGINKYDYSSYFIEDMNIVDDISEKNSKFIEDTILIIDNKGNKINLNDQEILENSLNTYKQYVPVALFTQPCSLEEYNQDLNDDGKINKDERLFKKVYFKYRLSIDSNYIITPINITLYPYSEIHKQTNIYKIHDTYLASTCSMLENYKFTLINKFCFNHDGLPSLICHFDYPLKDMFKDNFGKEQLTEAYCFYHHIVNRNIYKNVNLDEEYKEELDEIRCLNNIDEDTKNFLIRSGVAIPGKDLSYYIEKLKEERYKVFIEDYIDEHKATIDFFGFRVEISSDSDFKNIIYKKNYSLFDITNKNKIFESIENDTISLDIFKILDDGVFTNFDMTQIFKYWKEMPDTICIKVIFIDRFIGNEIVGNEIYVDKEKFKYMTENDNLYRLSKLTKINNDMKEINVTYDNDLCKASLLEIIDDCEPQLKSSILQWFNNEYSKLVDTTNGNKFNFVNQINCIIKNNDKSNNTRINNDPEINMIYKPIFFATNKLNNVNIKVMQNQNIGIDLQEYMSKVSQFIMTLDGKTYYEIGRNSVFVLFNINAKELKENEGTYEIYNQDHEYITYGQWSIKK